MTPAQTRANGLVIPSPLDHWIDAMLRVLVELVRNVASTLWMNRRRPPAECHSDAPPAVLPEETTDTQHPETQPAAPHSQRPQALILRSASQTRVSKDERVLTAASYKLLQRNRCPFSVPLIPAKAGIQERLRDMHGLEAPTRNKPHRQPWIPAFAGMSGERVRPAGS